MKQLIFLTLILFMSVSALFGQIPQKLNYQGLLTDANGNPLNGDYDLTFKLYTALTGGQSIWEERQNVTVSDGVFNVIMGTLNPLNLPFDQAYWLGITVDNGSELEPRIRLTATAYSLNTRSIIDGQVVKSINNLRDDVTLAAGDNITITENGGNLTITATTEGGAGLSLPYESTINSSDAAFTVRNTGSGEGIIVSGSQGIIVDSANPHNGVVVNTAGNNGMAVVQAASNGVLVVQAGENGLYVLEATKDGILIKEAGTVSTTHAADSRNNGVEVQGAQADGIFVGRADQIGINVQSTGSNGVQVGETGFDGLQVQSAGRDGVRVSNAADYGINVTGTKGAAFLNGDVTVAGAMKGNNGPNNGAPFPRPAYDSSWITLAPNEFQILQHNIGGNIDDYVVDMTFKSGNVIEMGFRDFTDDDFFGAIWENLTNTTIQVRRFSSTFFAEQVRVRIWVIQ